MGITISRTVNKPPISVPIPIILPPLLEKKHDDDDRANLKLQSHTLNAFNGQSTEFPKWKIHMGCVFNRTGFVHCKRDFRNMGEILLIPPPP
jgi:hypothetical protein